MKGRLVASTKGNKLLERELRTSFCCECNKLFKETDKKSQVSEFYLCYLCFYTTATHTEFEEKSKKILEILKKKV